MGDDSSSTSNLSPDLRQFQVEYAGNNSVFSQKPSVDTTLNRNMKKIVDSCEELKNEIREHVQGSNDELKSIRKALKAQEEMIRNLSIQGFRGDSQARQASINNNRFVLRHTFEKVEDGRAQFGDQEEHLGFQWYLGICDYDEFDDDSEDGEEEENEENGENSTDDEYKPNYEEIAQHYLDLDSVFAAYQKNGDDEDDFDYDSLYLNIFCKNATDTSLWGVRADVEITLRSENGDSCCIKKAGALFKSEDRSSDSWITVKFGNFDEMVKKYAVDGKWTIDADITFIKEVEIGRLKFRDFGEAMKDVSDVVINVQDEKFHVSKMYLAAQSPHFKHLFDKSTNSEVALHGTIPEDFQCFLELLYGDPALTETNVDGILQIAVRFGVPTVILKCEHFLLKESKFSLEKKLQMSMVFKLESLQSKCLSEIKSAADIRSVLPKDIKQMDVSVLAALLEKALDFQKN